jgi:nitroreductase
MDFESFEQVLSRQRAIRLFDTSRPVGDELVAKLLGAAVRAPNGGNRQQWRFLVVRDGEQKRRLGAVFDELGESLYGDRAPQRTPWAEAPIVIVACSEAIPSAPTASTSPPGASVYPAVQNILLAATVLGLGSVLTTRWKRREAEMKQILGLPEAYEVHAILPVGWPARRFGRNRRGAFADVTFRDRYGQPW